MKTFPVAKPTVFLTPSGVKVIPDSNWLRARRQYSKFFSKLINGTMGQFPNMVTYGSVDLAMSIMVGTEVEYDPQFKAEKDRLGAIYMRAASSDAIDGITSQLGHNALMKKLAQRRSPPN